MNSRRLIIVSTADFLAAINQELNPMSEDSIAVRNALIQQWRTASAALSKAKDEEATLRAQLTVSYFDANKEKGTENLELGDGYKLKCVKKLSAKIDRQRIDAKLDAIEAIGPAAKFHAERLFKWTPELSITEWNEVSQRAEGGDETCTAIMEVLIGGPGEVPVVTFAPAMPSLEFVEPKAK